jgi:hypothetical protein
VRLYGLRECAVKRAGDVHLSCVVFDLYRIQVGIESVVFKGSLCFEFGKATSSLRATGFSSALIAAAPREQIGSLLFERAVLRAYYIYLFKD